MGAAAPWDSKENRASRSAGEGAEDGATQTRRKEIRHLKARRREASSAEDDRSESLA